MQTSTRLTVLALLVGSFGCGSSTTDPAATMVDPGDGGPTTMTTGDETWADGKHLDASVSIAAGATVIIAPDATITAASGISITVKGTLKAASAQGHAKITGDGWDGIIVASGGTLALDGVDLTNALTALNTQASDAAASYDNGTISGSKTPFLVDAGSTLTTAHASVTGTKGETHISGAFTASHLDYDSNGREGLVTLADTAALTVDDSILHGSGPIGDMVVARAGAASIHVGFTEIKNVHCAFHFDAISTFDVDHVNAHDNVYAFMMYGSGNAGSRTVKSSNLTNDSSMGVDESGTNGMITISDGYWAMNGTGAADNLHKTDSAIVVTNMSTTTPVANAGPRP
ncbi:MAG: hypothetical protein ABIP39_00735 [Polyangiaceae bacterium]